MRKSATLALTIVLLPVAAMAASFKYGPLGPDAVKRYQLPLVDTEAEVEVGRSLLEEGRVTRTIEVLEPMAARSAGQQVFVAPGYYRIVAQNETGIFYQAVVPLKSRALGMTSDNADAGVFIPTDSAETPEMYWRAPIGIVYHSPLPGLKFQDAPPLAVAGGFRRELIYGGASKGVLKLTYREFNNDMARPAFTQELTYDLADGDEIGFKGARFKVIKTTNAGMTYTVTRPLAPD